MHPKSSFLVGLIGSGIAASRTPPMHEAAADAAGIRYLYKMIDLAELKLDVEALPELLTAARRMGFDMGRAFAEYLGVKAEFVPLAVANRIPALTA